MSAGVVVYAVAYISATILLLPGSIPLSGFATGHCLATLVSPVSVSAATVAFVLGRTVARVDHERVGASTVAAIGAIRRARLKIVSNLVPFSVLNYALGLARMRLHHYVFGSFIGMLPATSTSISGPS
jgi:uncharacterized membrane protein YdjX (TVP38/TMEM64 family)